ncbi:hypothetical protein [Paenibacillus sp. yr247]|uniref:hypothetical protein n=1 Tax=Paenibacillus sp. yr247 TaxID=1761880 RepID=UPI0020C836B8|nr:hypothetical protein [Paenibacillus sp. yr247]
MSVILAFLEVPSLLKKGWTKELAVFSVLLLAGTSLCIALSLQAKLPNPVNGIRYFFEPLGKWIMAKLS